MKIIMDIVLYLNDPDPQNRHTLGIFRKEIESDILPTVGTKIEEPVWSEPREIKELVINYSEGYCYVSFGLEYLVKEEYYQTYKEMYESHGWKRPSAL